MKRKVTIKDVAREAGVSIATVSYVINGIEKVTDETKNRVLRTIDELGYNPNLIARSLVKGESRSLGILVPVSEKNQKSIFTENPFYQEFFSGVEYKARECGYSTIIIGTGNEKNCLNFLKSSALAGVMVLGLMSEKLNSMLLKLRMPVLVIDNEKKDNRFKYLNSEDEKGAFDAVNYLISKGHKNIAFITGALKDSIVHKNRYNGYKKALEMNNIAINEKYIITTDLDYDSGIEVSLKIKELINEVTAVFCISDILALGLIKGLHKNNIYVPRDISVMGFDDIKYCKYFIPELTTMNQNIFYKGEKAVEILVENMKEKLDEKQISIPVNLVERESVKSL